tara:strand:- start:270 stop:692 length:423 start_codon:yes stop_codon:yes gene_type:complete
MSTSNPILNNSRNFQDWDMMDQLMSNKLDKIIQNQNEILDTNKKILKMLNDNRGLYTKKLDETITTEKKTLNILKKTDEKHKNLNKNMSNDLANIRIDNRLWREYSHRNPYSDPTFGRFVKNVLFGTSPNIVQNQNNSKR